MGKQLVSILDFGSGVSRACGTMVLWGSAKEDELEGFGIDHGMHIEENHVLGNVFVATKV